jgi:hypothetical protein
VLVLVLFACGRHGVYACVEAEFCVSCTYIVSSSGKIEKLKLKRLVEKECTIQSQDSTVLT